MESPTRTSPSAAPPGPDPRDGDEGVGRRGGAIALPPRVAGSGALDRLADTARDYARAAAFE